MIYLVTTFAYIALVTLGGGYAMIPLIQNETIYLHRWITESDFVNILAISQITPGAISINSSTFIGFTTYGILGAILASIGLILPSTIIIYIIAPILKKYENNKIRLAIFAGIRPAVTGLIASAIFIMAKTVFITDSSISIPSISITTVAFIALRIFKPKPILVLLFCAICGAFL